MKYSTIFLLFIGVLLGQSLDGKFQVGIATISSVVLFAFDDEIREFSDKSFGEKYQPVAQIVSDIGSPIVEISAFSLLFLNGNFSRNSPQLKLEKNGISAIAISGISVEILKHLASRERPEVAGNSHQWRGFSKTISRYFSDENPDDFSSFPSGHSALAWATAAVVSKHFDKKTVSILAYFAATFVSFSRIVLEEHWASDVVFGAGIGYFVGKNIDNPAFQIYPKFSQAQCSINFVANF